MLSTEPKVAVPISQDLKLSSLPATNDGDIAKLVSGLVEESEQIIELTEMEKAYSTDVVSCFCRITSALNESYHLRVESISENDSSVSDAVLTPNGVVCVFRGNDLIASFSLESMACENLMEILRDVIPKVESLLKTRRQKIGHRVTTLEKLISEIRKVNAAGSSSA